MPPNPQAHLIRRWTSSSSSGGLGSAPVAAIVVIVCIILIVIVLGCASMNRREKERIARQTRIVQASQWHHAETNRDKRVARELADENARRQAASPPTGDRGDTLSEVSEAPPPYQQLSAPSPTYQPGSRI